MQQYDPKKIEKKWQDEWENAHLHSTPKNVTCETKQYILPQLPYPSGAGLHVGHAEVYTACDIFARFSRMNGKKVLQVIGWDSFGLPAENYAIKTNVHPKESTEKAIDNFRAQIKRLGISVDWDREVGSHQPDYYRWTQWFFLLMYKRGLAYRKSQLVNWCDGCKTVLANEQVVNGACERCDTRVIQKDMEQWYLKITSYADRLLKDLEKIDWPEETKKRQADWIGRSDGAYVTFAIDGQDQKIRVYTTRPDTLFGATYIVLAPEHELIDQWKDVIENADEVRAYREQTASKTELERQHLEKEKTGVELKGINAINPANNELIPIWIADYVLVSYGTGAIMAVPAHDERDFEFAKKFGLPMKRVIASLHPSHLIIEKSLPDGAENELKKYGDVQVEKVSKNWGKFWRVTVERKTEPTLIEYLKRNLLDASEDGGAWYSDSVGSSDIVVMPDMVYDVSTQEGMDAFVAHGKKTGIPDEQLVLDVTAFTGDGVAINSDFLNDLAVDEAKQNMIEWLEEYGVGERAVQYKLRDWSVSRQRFWGAPIPMLYDADEALHPVPEEDLPVLLPNDVDFKPTGQSPLTYSDEFQHGVEEKYGKGWKREPDTLDTFMCSSWYYYRYLDPHNNTAFASSESLKTWMPVDFYLGGPEHVNGHLLYARFFTKVLFDAGYINFDEPFTVHRHQGLILGEDGRKMSKRWGNSINPDDVVDEHGADTLRMYEMFMGPLENDKPWSTDGVRGIRRFLDRVWKLHEKVLDENGDSEADSIQKSLHQTIKKVSADTAHLQFNTAIAHMMSLVNVLAKATHISRGSYQTFLLLLAPYAPHIAEELWQLTGGKGYIVQQSWPAYSEDLAAEDEIELVIQINGKIRDRIMVSAGLADDELQRIARASEKIKENMGNAQPKQIIVVRGKLVNIVV